MDIGQLALIASSLLFWVALVHLPMAFGVRRGELVWGGRFSRRLPAYLRRRSLGYGILLLLSAWVLGAMGGVIDLAPVPDHWLRSAGWVVTVSVGLAALLSFVRGSWWERYLMGPMTLFAAVVAGWMTFG